MGNTYSERTLADAVVNIHTYFIHPLINVWQVFYLIYLSFALLFIFLLTTSFIWQRECRKKYIHTKNERERRSTRGRREREAKGTSHSSSPLPINRKRIRLLRKLFDPVSFGRMLSRGPALQKVQNYTSRPRNGLPSVSVGGSTVLLERRAGILGSERSLCWGVPLTPDAQLFSIIIIFLIVG